MGAKLIRGSVLCANGVLNDWGYSVQTAAFPTAGRSAISSFNQLKIHGFITR